MSDIGALCDISEGWVKGGRRKKHWSDWQTAAGGSEKNQLTHTNTQFCVLTTGQTSRGREQQTRFFCWWREDDDAFRTPGSPAESRELANTPGASTAAGPGGWMNGGMDGWIREQKGPWRGRCCPVNLRTTLPGCLERVVKVTMVRYLTHINLSLHFAQHALWSSAADLY